MGISNTIMPRNTKILFAGMILRLTLFPLRHVVAFDLGLKKGEMEIRNQSLTNWLVP